MVVMQARRRVGAFTVVEVLVALAIVTALIAVIYGLSHQLFGSGSRSSLTGLTRRSFLQKDAKAGVRRLMYRLREAIQILAPPPGTSANELVFRDITNAEVRLRHVAGEERVISERKQGGAWVEEREPATIATDSGPIPATWPVLVRSCRSIRFSALSPDSVTVHATLVNEGALGSMMTVVKLRNARQAY